jgi:hypothetical protein
MPLVSDDRLSAEEAQKVDALIRLFRECAIIEPVEVAARRSRASAEILAKMLDEQLTHGEASDAPDFFNQSEVAFRAFLKDVDNDLGWQCDTVSAAFERYLKIGEVPAPHFPMRVAVLLRKAKSFERERSFLAAWCKHFPSGNGVKFAQLVERARSAGAVLRP